MLEEKLRQMELSRLHRAASVYSETGTGTYKSILNTAFRLNAITEHEMAKELGVDILSVKNLRKGNAPSAHHARRAASVIADRLNKDFH